MDENFSMEWNMDENFTMEWKVFSMEWKWNGRKLPVWNMEKSSSIPVHSIPCPGRQYYHEAPLAEAKIPSFY